MLIKLKSCIVLTVVLASTGVLVVGCNTKEDAPSAPATGTATLTWSANTEPDLAGYKVYIGTASDTFASLAGAANPTAAAFGSPISIEKEKTTFQVTNLPIGQTYKFAVTAVDSSGNESDFSNEARKFVELVDSGVPVRQGSTYYVTKTGSDGNSCAQATNEVTPKLTINAGIACLASGDTLIVKGGIYDEHLDNPFSNTGTSWSNKITVKAESRRSVIIRSPSVFAALHFGDASQKYIEFDGIEINAMQANVGILIRDGANHIRFKNSAVLGAMTQALLIQRENPNSASPDFNEFINVELAYTAMNQDGSRRLCDANDTREDGLCHGFYIGSNNNLLEGMDLHHNNGNGGQFFPEGNYGNTIRNSRAHDNFFYGIDSHGSTNRIINNVVYNNGAGLQISESNGVSSALVFHNTLYNNNRHRDLTGFTGSGNGHKIKNNIVYQTNVDHISLDSSNLVGVDPQFRDAANGDLRLKASSPAIDAGISLPEVRRAINGIRRPQGVASDIGAYEFDTASPGVDIIPPAPPMDLGAF